MVHSPFVFFLIIGNGLALEHSESCEKLENLPKTKYRYRPTHPEHSPLPPKTNYEPESRWPKQLDEPLVSLLSRCLSSKEPISGLNENDIAAVSAHLSDQFQTNVTTYDVKARFKELGRQYDMFLRVRSQVPWDAETSTFDRQRLQDYLFVHPEDRAMEAPLRINKQLATLFTQ